MNNLRKDKRAKLVLRVSLVWLMVFYVVCSLFMILYLYRNDLNELREEVQITTQELHTCQSNMLEIEKQIDSGRVILELKK